MRTLLIGLLIGILAGGALVYFTFVGVPRSDKRPGDAIKPPDANSHPTAQVVLKEDLLNQVLSTIFQQMNPPSFPLASLESGDDGYKIVNAQANGCDSRIQLLPEGSGVRTGVSFKDGKISAPMAFTGQYNSMFGCIPLTGWAQAHLDLRFDAGQQAVYGIVTVETVNLDGVNPVVSGIVTPLVQGTLNQRVNPILLLRGEQIGMNVPVASAGGSLRARASDIRAEVKDDGVVFSVDYKFEGDKSGGT
ncbi:MAG TPA: hypothetical protein VL501_00345 [Pyrinomonadaceae bacterium]|nr:hypothetical protein [Pyrinomonadaceae bacterium]